MLRQNWLSSDYMIYYEQLYPHQVIVERAWTKDSVGLSTITVKRGSNWRTFKCLKTAKTYANRISQKKKKPFWEQRKQLIYRSKANRVSFLEKHSLV